MNNYIVYKHTSPNGKVYIGITCQKPENRWRNGEGYKECTKFYRSIQKYSWNNFKHEILYFDLNEISAKMIEEDLIYYYKKLNISLNITDGGDSKRGIIHSKESIQKSSKGHFKSVSQYSINGILIATYNSVKEAFLNTRIRHISSCCREERKTAGGFIWKYEK